MNCCWFMQLLLQNHRPEVSSLRTCPGLMVVRISPTGNADFWTFRPCSPLHRKLCCCASDVAAKRSGLHRCRGVTVKDFVGQCSDKRRWHTSRRSRVCFVWRNEAGGGESPQRRWAPAKHHRILAPIPGSGFALHCICCIADRPCFCKVHGGRCSCFEDTPLHIFVAAMTGRGLLSTAARPTGEEADWFGTVGRSCGRYSVCGACKYHPLNTSWFSLRDKGERKQHVFSVCITVWKRQEYWRPCKCNYSL